ncbi:MAG: sulfurtransferase complex subunit TusC [Pseudohongiellaceae bacterium]
MTEQIHKTFTFITRQAPYGSSTPASCLDMVLACAVFDQSVNIVFADDGVYQLVEDQHGDAVGMKTLSSQLSAMEIYGVQQVYIDEDSLRSRGLGQVDLAISGTLISRSTLAQLLRKSDAVFTL